MHPDWIVVPVHNPDGVFQASSNKKRKEQVADRVEGPIVLHLNKLDGRVSGAGDPNDPQNQRDWKKDIRRHLKFVKDKLAKVKEPLSEVMRKERGWTQEQFQRFADRLTKHGLNME